MFKGETLGWCALQPEPSNNVTQEAGCKDVHHTGALSGAPFAFVLSLEIPRPHMTTH